MPPLSVCVFQKTNHMGGCFVCPHCLRVFVRRLTTWVGACVPPLSVCVCQKTNHMGGCFVCPHCLRVFFRRLTTWVGALCAHIVCVYLSED